MTKPLPIIGIPIYRDYQGHPLWATPTRYVEAVQEAGGQCLPLPPFCSAAVLAQLYDMLDGLLLVGGGDVAPERYGQPPSDTLRVVDPERDALELTLTRWALRDELPILGICRGIQTLNVAAGGTLIQDIPSQWRHPLVHSMDRSLPRAHLQHQVRCQLGSLLADVLSVGEALLPVNSMHHQCVDAIGQGLTVTAWATDGVPEGLEAAAEGRFVLGVQWHPEEMVPEDAVMRRLFARFVAACEAAHG